MTGDSAVEHLPARLRRLTAMHLALAGMLAIAVVVTLIVYSVQLGDGEATSGSAVLLAVTASLLMHGGMAAVALAAARPTSSPRGVRLGSIAVVAVTGILVLVLVVGIAVAGRGGLAVAAAATYMVLALPAIATLRTVNAIAPRR
ncbi:hypothetical protein [Demequina sp.]|uniref:hypothetical protein n=1 Tax=Demequina sp. TaxID=2050685 RepID=UPI003A87CAD8